MFFAEFFLAIIILVSLFFFRKSKPDRALRTLEQQPEHLKNSTITITSQDIRAIAGDDVLTTQLDLARAYIEIGKTKLAQKILDHVVKHGTDSQKKAAYQLMTTI